MTYQEHLIERELLEKEFSLIDYFAANIYVLESQLSNGFSWAWLALNNEVKESYRNKAKDVFEMYQNNKDSFFKQKTEIKFKNFIENEISRKLSR